MPKLTDKNYFTDANNHLSASKIKDYLKSPYYFYRKHILKTIPRHQTPSMVIGSGVDCWLTRSKASFSKKFKAVERRNLKEPPKDYTEITFDQLETITNISQSVLVTSAYKKIKKLKFKSQEILTFDGEFGKHFDGLCGIPDWYHISPDGTEAVIVDLKTTSNLDKFSWQVKDFDYYLQLAFYGMLLEGKYEKIESIDYYILAAETDEPYRVKLFSLDDKKIKFEYDHLRTILNEISNKEEYKPEDTSFEYAETI
jgi:hypothetical protein